SRPADDRPDGLPSHSDAPADERATTPALTRAAAAAARKHPSHVNPATSSIPFLASSTSTTPATHTSAPATADWAPVARTGASHHGSRRCSNGDSSQNVTVITTANTSS